MPRLGLGSLELSSLGGTGQDVVTTIDDFFFESNASGEVNPMLTTSRTNLITYSEDFSQDFWNKTSVTVASSTITSPDGLQSSYKLVPDSGTGGNRSLGRSFTGLTGVHTMSVFAKKGEYNYLMLRTRNTPTSAVMFNLDNGTSATNVSGDTFVSSKMENAGDGWYRCSMTVDPSLASSPGATYLSMSVGITGSETHAFNGDGSSGIFVYGFQFEQDGFASAYIPTSGSTVTVSTTLNDTSEVWDFDSTDIMLEADPEDEGFWEEGSNLVLNHDYADLGSELVTNGDFATGDFTGWVNNTSGNASIVNNQCVFTNASSGSNIQQTPPIVIGKTYISTFDIISITQGAFKIYADSGGGKSDVGKYSFTWTATDTNWYVRASGTTSGVIDNVTVKQVDPNDRWTLGTGVTIEDGKLKINGGALQGAQQSNVITSGTPCSVTFTVSNYVSGTVNLRHPLSQEVSANGTYTFTGDANSTKVLIRGSAVSNEFTIDNVTVREYAIQPLDV